MARAPPGRRTGIRNRALLTLLYRSGPARLRGRSRSGRPTSTCEHSIRVLHGKGDKATTRGFHPTATDALARWIDTRKARGIRRGARCSARSTAAR